ncbi:MAG: hypothetical protein QOF48_181 [Verrucomicrobiota bacterium]
MGGLGFLDYRNPKKAQFFCADLPHVVTHRAAVQKALKHKCPRWAIWTFEWSYAGTLICFIGVIAMLIFKVLNR